MPTSDKHRPNLDGPPPQAPGVVRRAPEPAMSAAMGMGSPAVTSATMPQAVLEQAMMVENSLTALAKIAPVLTPIVAQMIDSLHMNVAQVIQGGQQPMGMEMASPAPSPQPAGLGAGMPAMA